MEKDGQKWYEGVREKRERWRDEWE